MAEYRDIFGAAGLGVAEEMANKRAPVVSALGSNGMLLSLAALAADTVFARHVPNNYRLYVHGAADGGAYAIARRLMQSFGGSSSSGDVVDFVPVDAGGSPFPTQPNPAFGEQADPFAVSL